MKEARVLVLCDYYLPGFRAGGPVRTIANTVSRLGDEFDFSIVTRNRDAGRAGTSFDLPEGDWIAVGKARVLYLSTWKLHGISWRRLMRRGNYDVVQLNSLFSRISIRFLALRRLRLVPAVPVVLAPRGELSLGALSLKRWRKRAFLLLAKRAGLYNGVVWQASTEHEAADIRAEMGRIPVEVRIAPDLLPSSGAVDRPCQAPKKERGSIKVIVLSRICRKKNFAYAIRALTRAHASIDLTIAGPAEDAEYWEECLKLLRDAGPNLRWEYVGEVPYEDVQRTMEAHHLFFLPTLGENFGHVIAEALRAGCLVLVSDRTPWRDLQRRGVGWSLPLEDSEAFVQALEEAAGMPDEEFVRRSRAAAAWGEAIASASEVLAQNAALFRLPAPSRAKKSPEECEDSVE